MNYYLDAFQKYAIFSGRASKKDYWMFVLMNIIIIIILALLKMQSIMLTYELIAFIPNIAVATRRLHDTGKSGYWQFVSLIPLLGALYLIYLLTSDSQKDENEYGPALIEKISATK